MSLVFVYKNLHKDCYSVRDESTRRVVAHQDFVHLTDVAFKVSEAGRQRVLRERRKNVHAGVRGNRLLRVRLSTLSTAYQSLSGWQRVCYDPYKGPSFTCEGKPVSRASEALLTPQGVFARDLS